MSTYWFLYMFVYISQDSGKSLICNTFHKHLSVLRSHFGLCTWWRYFSKTWHRIKRSTKTDKKKNREKVLEVPEHFEVTCESLNCNTTLNKHQFRYLIHSVAHWSSRRLINNSFFKLQYNSEYKYQRWVHHLSNTALEIYTFHHLINFIVNTFFSNQSVCKEFIYSSTNTEKFSVREGIANIITDPNKRWLRLKKAQYTDEKTYFGLSTWCRGHSSFHVYMFMYIY